MHRIAMWSGPRNISTALMRSFENRPDTTVVDEPLYACYLHRSGIDHPGKKSVIASGETSYERVTRHLTTDKIPPYTVYYQKQMAHHVFRDDPLDWLFALKNLFLVRNPAAMLVSLHKVLGSVTIEQTGLPQQRDLLNFLQENNHPVAVIDTVNILNDPRASLTAVCKYFDIPFCHEMLNWPAGPRDTDGVWAKYWYDSVNSSTGFHRHEASPVTVPKSLAGVLDECEHIYSNLLKHSLC